MKAASALARLWRISAVALLLVTSVACGSSDNNPNPTPTPDPVAAAPGDFFVTRFLVTNTANPQDVIDGASFGLSIYFVLNENGTLTGSSQSPSDPPESQTLSGDWDLVDGTLTLTFTDSDGAVRTVTGTLSFDADDDVVFAGLQTGGAPLELGDNGQSYTISTFEMHQYSSDVTNADLAGTWTAVSGTAFKNTDSSVSENALVDGAGLALVFNVDGDVEVLNTLAGGNEDNFLATYSILDNFHLDIVLDEGTQSLTYGLVDGELTVFIYENNRTFEGDSVESPATLVYTLEKS